MGAECDECRSSNFLTRACRECCTDQMQHPFCAVAGDSSDRSCVELAVICLLFEIGCETGMAGGLMSMASSSCYLSGVFTGRQRIDLVFATPSACQTKYQQAFPAHSQTNPFGCHEPCDFGHALTCVAECGLRLLVTVHTPCTFPKPSNVTIYTGGVSDVVTSMTAPIATGRSENCQVGLSPTEKHRLFTAHSHNGHSDNISFGFSNQSQVVYSGRLASCQAIAGRHRMRSRYFFRCVTSTPPRDEDAT